MYLRSGLTDEVESGKCSTCEDSMATPERAVQRFERKRLTNYTAADVGGIADAFRLAQAAGVSSAVWLIGRSAIPGRTEPR